MLWIIDFTPGDCISMSTNAGAVVSSEPHSDIAVSNEVTVMVWAESLDSETETLTTEPSSGGIIVQDLVNDARVSGGEIGILMDKDEKLLDESSSDAGVASEPPSNGDIAVSEGVAVMVGAELLDLKTETPTAQPSSGGIIVQDLVDDARVSGGEIGIVMDEDEKLLDESSSDAVVASVPPAASDGVKIGADLLESKPGTLIIETSDHDGGGDVVVQDSIDEARVSGDEIGVVMDNNEKPLDESTSDAVVSSVPPSASYGVKSGADLLESKSGTLIAESSDHDGRGDFVVQDSIDEARVSEDETGIVTENSELVLDKPISDAVNGVKIGADSLGSKTETQTTKPSADQNAGGDIAVQDSVDDSRVSGDEKGIVMEKFEKVSDENEVINEVKEGEYKVADIVWAKVKNYPWWPGQIFDPSSSTDKAKKYSNKKGFLVGYFGDQTFAWNKPSNLKPFRKNFCKLEKQGNSKAFFHAVDCALDEVSRRVDFGLACSCLSKEVYDKVKSQVFVSYGIREEASKIDGGDRFSTVSTFKPVKVVQSVQELAREHFDGFSRLEVLSMRTQLLAFFRWKGYYQFQAQNILDAPENKLEDESELPSTEENKVVKDEKPASVGKKVYSKKRKPDVSDSDDSVSRKKERSVTNVTPKGNSSVEKGKKGISKKAAIEDNVLKKENRNEKTDSVGKKVSSKKRKPDVCDSDDSVPRKKERSLTNVTSKDG
ncbi:hypothetical protein L1987_81627 [Smallanthus sonchifolius]|uniref:Uncharacterized protein n=1 Tax=Smallanthus sonchifolius TaxID=185202 RepID=A0ACB8YRL0_9ASTR|nr:hypothetical protein L1987_81627 [Smallanthus sonchifolius]